MRLRRTRARSVAAAAALGLWATALPQARAAEPRAVSPVALRAVLHSDQRAINTWFWSWTGFFGGVATAQASVVAASNRGQLTDPALVGAVSSSLGLVGMGLTEVRPDLAQQVQPNNPALEDAALWDQLRLQARREAAGRAWPNHVLAAAVAVGGGLWLAFGRDRPVEGAVNSAVSLAVGELQLWTQPTRALDAWKRWRPGEAP